MKLNDQIESVKRLSRYDDPNRRGGSFPRTTFEYQAPRGSDSTFGGGRSTRPPGFTRLANEVLGSNSSFGLETAVFGFITIVSAWPMAMMIREVIRLLK